MFVLVALAAVLVLAAPVRADVQPRIVHGNTNASITDFPFQVLLYKTGTDPRSTAPSDPGGRFCGGVIRDATHIITAAHCVFDVFKSGQVSSPSDVSVLAGTDDLNPQDNTAERVVASRLSFDPQYNPETAIHDVAIITLPDDQALWNGAPPTQDGNTPVAPIDLINHAQWSILGPGDELTVSGWGDTNQEPVDLSQQSPLFDNHLASADVPLVETNTCSADYALYGVPIDASFLFCAGDHNPGSGIADACQGDSGGPIVDDLGTPSTHHYVLAGLVDSGLGCAQPHLPGIYTLIDNADIRNFLTTVDPVQAPQQNGGTTISGGTEPGQTLTCDPGSWNNTQSFTYQFFRDGAGLLATGSTYVIQQTDRGTRIFCQVKATNAGGYGYGTSGFVSVPPTVPTQPPPAAKDTAAPTLRVTSKTCTRTSCTIRLQVRDASPSSGIKTVRASLRWTERVACQRRSKSSRAASTCSRSKKRTLRAKAGSSGRFTITATRLKPSTHYDFVLSAVDKAGNVQKRATRTSVRTKRPAVRRS